jgi:hypothetical protein
VSGKEGVRCRVTGVRESRRIGGCQVSDIRCQKQPKKKASVVSFQLSVKIEVTGFYEVVVSRRFPAARAARAEAQVYGEPIGTAEAVP